MLHDFNRQLELPDRLETDYLRVLYYDFPQKYSDSYKSYEYTRLCTILEGEKHISVDKEDTFKYDSDKFLLLPPNSNVHMTMDKPTKALVFELNDALVKKVSENVSENYDVDYNLLIKDQLLCSQKNSEFKDVLNKINKLLTTKNKGTEFILDLYAQEMVYNLIQVKGARQIMSFEPDNPVNKAIQYMKDNYMMPISIKRISNDLGMSEANFCQYFKKITGVSPKKYLTNIKMEKAKNIIAHESVTEAAFDVGYENISHFISLFKEKYGVTPKQYKNMAE
jgi:AraC-like DNA-binding protein